MNTSTTEAGACVPALLARAFPTALVPRKWGPFGGTKPEHCRRRPGLLLCHTSIAQTGHGRLQTPANWPCRVVCGHSLGARRLALHANVDALHVQLLGARVLAL
mmetsp:Transcript_102021/g.283954  ORF Transcript_102021/g.283954 Transcript_102021/m.283954 type:complete len:104 (-) Transcript_102021:389-700(-)